MYRKAKKISLWLLLLTILGVLTLMGQHFSFGYPWGIDIIGSPFFLCYCVIPIAPSNQHHPSFQGEGRHNLQKNSKKTPLNRLFKIDPNIEKELPWLLDYRGKSDRGIFVLRLIFEQTIYPFSQNYFSFFMKVLKCEIWNSYDNYALKKLAFPNPPLYIFENQMVRPCCRLLWLRLVGKEK